MSQLTLKLMQCACKQQAEGPLVTPSQTKTQKSQSLGKEGRLKGQREAKKISISCWPGTERRRQSPIMIPASLRSAANS
jgi:hypothetical protein